MLKEFRSIPYPASWIRKAHDEIDFVRNFIFYAREYEFLQRWARLDGGRK